MMDSCHGLSGSVLCLHARARAHGRNGGTSPWNKLRTELSVEQGHCTLVDCAVEQIMFAAKCFALLVTVVPLVYSFDCKPAVQGATWDFTALKQTLYVTGGDIACTWDKIEKNYGYSFSPCGPATLPKKCVASTHCPLDGASTAGVVQVDGTECCIAGSTAAASTEPYDSKDRSKGISVILKGGQQCQHPTPTPRRTTINILCDTRAKEPKYDHANEPSHCHYDITMYSIHGCPKECPIEQASGFVCGDHGICKTDTVIDAVRCFCDEGYTGSDCSVKGSNGNSSGYGGIIALMVILFIIMIAMGGAIFYLVKQMAGFKKDNDTYMALRETNSK